jgi:DNA-nicking Smr family endonuclease
MVKKVTDSQQSLAFTEIFADAKPLTHNQFVQDPKERRALNKKLSVKALHEQKRSSASFEFSDGFEAFFDPDKTLKYARPGAQATQEIKRLRRGEFVPELSLDLHGLNSTQTKLELAAVIDEAMRRCYECILIIHGVSGGVLRQKVPNYLVQHPKVLGFHQATLEWGGRGAILVLIDCEQLQP